ncbi:MAG: hypothetical protein IT392_01060 [Nitrospirae bacterium]|nr:hypothetical protein [Nitrospirota bacterium]
MKDVQGHLKGFRIGDPGTHENLTLYPIFRDEEPVLEYLMLDEVLKLGVVTITEIDESGSVSELNVRNDSDMAILLLDGEELAGAKQDRIINTTILVAPQSTMVIPVSCVEQGRWHYKSMVFSTDDRMYKPTDRGKKAKRVFESINAGTGYDAGQSDIWREVAFQHALHKTSSRTQSMADIYEHQRGNLDDYIQGFKITEGQTGFIALINGKITGLEALSRPRAFSIAWPKLIRSYALDAIDMRMNEGSSMIPPLEKGGMGGFDSPDSITSWLASINPRDLSIHKSPGLGDDIRWDEESNVGFILSYKDEAIHTAVFEVEQTYVRRSEFVY